MTRALQGHVLTPQGFVAGSLELDGGGRVRAVHGTLVDERAVRESREPIVLPKQKRNPPSSHTLGIRLSDHSIRMPRTVRV